MPELHFIMILHIWDEFSEQHKHQSIKNAQY